MSGLNPAKNSSPQTRFSAILDLPNAVHDSVANGKGKGERVV
jgi:hypothetical protein